ncbi:MAG: hypothetical protein J6Z43_10475 [Clostridiales bacterium]|nr:hypothetical protein [Clostridiales bacterium]
MLGTLVGIAVFVIAGSAIETKVITDRKNKMMEYVERTHREKEVTPCLK